MKENEDFWVKMSILGGRMVGNLIFIHFGTKETIPDDSPTQNRHFTLYFGYRGAKMTIFDVSIEIYSDKVNFGKIWVVSKYKLLKIIPKVRVNTLEVEKITLEVCIME